MIVYPDENYNSWISEDDANEYFETRLNADVWDALTNKEPALMTAFRSLAEFNLNIALEDDGIMSSEVYTDIEAETIVKALKQAQCEQAFHELIHDLDNPKISGFNLGGMLSVKLPTNQIPPSRHSERALLILRPYIIIGTATRTR